MCKKNLKIKEKTTRINDRIDNQFKVNRNRRVHVAQWIEHFSHSGEDVGSNLLRKSRHACEHFENYKITKEKQAYSLNKELLSLRGISHEFESIVEPNQNLQLNNYNNNNYLKVSVIKGANLNLIFV